MLEVEYEQHCHQQQHEPLRGPGIVGAVELQELPAEHDGDDHTREHGDCRQQEQARRLSDRTMFLWDGEIVEIDRTEVIFSGQPRSERTRDYVNGVFG